MSTATMTSRKSFWAWGVTKGEVVLVRCPSHDEATDERNRMKFSDATCATCVGSTRAKIGEATMRQYCEQRGWTVVAVRSLEPKVPACVKIRLFSGSANITDMADAGKRGKTCRRLIILGRHSEWPDTREPGAMAQRYTAQVFESIKDTADDFDTVRERVRDIIAVARIAGVPEGLLRCFDEEIKGIDAPRPKLTAGVDGVWSGSADEDGISLSDLADKMNYPHEITHGQTNATAYAIAKKVWPEVQRAQTMSEAAKVLRLAGAKLHGFCGMD